MVAEYPASRHAGPGDVRCAPPKRCAKAAKVAGEIAYPIADFYLTNPIAALVADDAALLGRALHGDRHFAEAAE